MADKIYTLEGVSKHYEEQNKPVSLDELGGILDVTIKHDVENKLICFLSMLLNYTSEDQMNIGFNAESSTGKSYIPLELAKYFPPEDIRIQGYTSPTAFFHEYGEWDNEKKVKTIDLKQKILIFVDQPHDMLLQRLRPLLSHDKRVIVHKITDRTKKRGLTTKSIQIRGYPTVIFCTTKFSLSDQERTRLLLLSPEIAPEKILSSIQLLSQKLSNRSLFNEALEEDSRRSFLKARVSGIKAAMITEVVIPEAIREKILDRFLEDHEFLIPRHQRDFPRLLGMIKAHALLNLYQRETTDIDGDRMLFVKEEDIDAGYDLYKGISKSNELGIPPEVYTFYQRVFIPEYKATGKPSTKDLSRRYYDTFHKTIGKKRLKKTVELLLESGLITEEKDPDDRRITVYSHVAGYILAPKPANFDKNKYPTGCEYPQISPDQAQAEFTKRRQELFTIQKGGVQGDT